MGGLPQMSPEMMEQMYSNPMVQQVMSQLSANPELLRTMIESNPMLQGQMTPQVRAMLDNPEFLRMATNPDVMRATAQMQAAMQRMQGGTGGTGPVAPGFGPFGGMGLPGSPPAVPPAAAAGQIPAEERFQQQLQQLNDMGFWDAAQNIRALTMTGGNVEAAIEFLLSNPHGVGLSDLEHWGRYAAAAYEDFEGWGSRGCPTCQMDDIRDTELVGTWSTTEPLGFSRGYVGVNAARREAVVVFRGSTHVMDALADAQAAQTQWPQGGEGSRVHVGFLLAYRAARAAVREALARVDGSLDLVFVGHSLGGAQAALAYVDYMNGVEEEGEEGRAARLVTFGAPRVGNARFARLVESLSRGADESGWRVVHANDAVPHLPLALPGGGYAHGGREAWWVRGGDGVRVLRECGAGEDARCSAGVAAWRWSVADHLEYPGLKLI
ncbi:hypothetical protein GGI02_003065 [Coemansia sp. RSA 2322]|nr:hypothetical protein GGI02_003065 [Coemansia sp. RSA 2322]